jgi:hypothetical protein
MLKNPIFGAAALICSLLSFTILCWLGWNGRLGLVAILLLGISSTLFFMGRKPLSKATKKRITQIAKLLFTFAGIMVLLRHPINTDVVSVEIPGQEVALQINYTGKLPVKTQLELVGANGSETVSIELKPGPNQTNWKPEQGGRYQLKCQDPKAVPAMRLPIVEAIQAYIGQVDGNTFLMFALIAMGIKFIGVLSSALAWHLLLIGQGVRFPYWQSTVTSFLIGRFIGTFLPSTIGLDGYTLYEAGRYSNQWHRVITAKGLEKFIGVTGLFLGMVVTLPFGYQVIVDVTEKLEKPEAAPILAAAILCVAGSVAGTVIIGLVYPSLLTWAMKLFGRFMPGRVRKEIEGFTEAVGAYRGKVGLLMFALFNKFITHFTTATVYYFTALAIGVATVSFWPIVFGSNIQILATLLSPTIAGEGAREAFQALLLDKQLGGVAQAVLSGALGFIAAEAATMWGGAFLWTRKPEWRPNFATVDGEQVDFDWLKEDDGGFSAERIAQIRSQNQ